MPSFKQGIIKYHFWIFGMTWSGIETLFPGPLAKAQLIKANGPVQKEKKLLKEKNNNKDERYY